MRTSNKKISNLLVKAALEESKSNTASAMATYNAGKYGAAWFVRMFRKYYNKQLDFYIVGEEEVKPLGTIHLTKDSAAKLLKVLDRVKPNSDELVAFIELQKSIS